jgi:pyruvate dehydrogenase E1 component alpha subunit
MRMHGHAAYDDMKYVPKEQVEEWRKKDPIDRQEARLRELGVDTDAVREEVRATIDAATDAALAMPMPDGATATQDVFFEPTSPDEEIVCLDGGAPWSYHRAGGHA